MVYAEPNSNTIDGGILLYTYWVFLGLAFDHNILVFVQYNNLIFVHNNMVLDNLV